MALAASVAAFLRAPCCGESQRLDLQASCGANRPDACCALKFHALSPNVLLSLAAELWERSLPAEDAERLARRAVDLQRGEMQIDAQCAAEARARTRSPSQRAGRAL